MSSKYRFHSPYYFGIENFRIFGKKQDIFMSPITVLIGPNGSGKSSIIRAFQFLSKNAKTKRFPEILKAEFPEIGITSFNQVLNKKTRNSTITFEFGLQASQKDGQQLLDGFVNTASIEFVYKLDKIKTQANLVSLYFTQPGESVPFFKVERNSEKGNYSFTISKGLLLHCKNKIDTNKVLLANMLNRLFPGVNNCSQYLKEINQCRFDDIKKSISADEYSALNISIDVLQILESEKSLSEENISQALDKFITSINSNADCRFSGIGIKYGGINKIINSKLNKLITFIWSDVLDFMDGFKNYFLEGCEFLEPTRSEYKKYFSRSDNSYLSKKLFSKGIKREKAVELLKLLNLGKDIEVKDIDGEFKRIIITLNDGFKYDLAELGFGYSQLIPILIDPDVLEDDLIDYRSLWLISEPEANLHPKLQSMLADVFAYSVNNDYSRFVIETHSEYLVRKLQYLVAKGDLSTEDVSIIYFNQENVNTSGDIVRNISIRPDGSLSEDFGSGFYDEADKIALDLFFMNNSQRN